MRRFQINPSDIKGNKASVIGQDARHIRRILRMKPDDMIELFDGSGLEYTARIASFDETGVNVLILDTRMPASKPFVQLIAAQSFLKERKMDDLIRPMTELGVSKWIPFFSERSVPKPDLKRLTHRAARWEAIARESLKQCRRSVVPEIGKPVSFQEALQISGSSDLKIFFWENETQPLIKIKTPVRSVFVMLGPEGGFSESEAEAAANNGFIIASLGARILRAETATIAACSIVQYLYGDMGCQASACLKI